VFCDSLLRGTDLEQFTKGAAIGTTYVLRRPA